MVNGTCSFGPDLESTYTNELQCTGNESALIDCTRNGTANTTCNGTANRTCDCDQYAVVNCCKLPEMHVFVSCNTLLVTKKL